MAAGEHTCPSATPVDPAVEALVWEHYSALAEERFSDAEVASLKLIALAMERVMENPDPILKLRIEASNHERTANWNAAELAYRTQLDRALAENDLIHEMQAWRDLSRFKRLLGKWHEALEYAQNALAASRGIDVGILAAMLLADVAVLHLKRDRPAEALSAITDALLQLDDERPFDLTRAILLVIKADALLAGGDRKSAENTLESCGETIAKHTQMQTAAGAHAAGASWWEVTARCSEAAHDIPAALDAWSNAVAFHRHFVALWDGTDPYARAALASTLAEYAQSAARLGQPQRAADLAAEARAIRMAAGLSQIAP